MSTATTRAIASQKPDPDRLYVCAIPFASPWGDISFGESLRGSHAAVQGAFKFFVPSGTPESEWPSAFDQVVENNETAEIEAREAAARAFEAEAKKHRIKLPEPDIVTATRDFTARYLGRPTTVLKGSKVLSDHELVEEFPGYWK